MANESKFPGIDDYMAFFAPYFHRSNGHGLAQSYVVGLMMDGERKSVEPMSERVHASERGMQRLLTEVKWDSDGAIGEYRRQMLAETSDPQGVLVIDDTGFPKKGVHSVCVARQYCGALGKVDSCQIGVSMTYVGQGVAWPYTMDLFIPESWDNPADSLSVLMRAETKMPATAHYREKWRIVLEQIDLARREGVPHRAVLSDSWYGNIQEFRKALDDRQERYVVGVYSDTEVFLDAPVFVEAEPRKKRRGRPRKYPKLIEMNPTPVKVSKIGLLIGETDWEHLEIRKDAKGKALVVEAISRRIWPAQGYRKGIQHEEVWLIIERRHQNNGLFELRYFFSNVPQDMPTLEIVRLSHERFWIEQGYQHLKEKLGLDHHEGRSWVGWHRHVLLVFLAFGYLTLLRIQEKKRQQQALWQQRILPQSTQKESKVT